MIGEEVMFAVSLKRLEACSVAKYGDGMSAVQAVSMPTLNYGVRDIEVRKASPPFLTDGKASAYATRVFKARIGPRS